MYVDFSFKKMPPQSSKCTTGVKVAIENLWYIRLVVVYDYYTAQSLSKAHLYKVRLKSCVQAGFKMAQEQLSCSLKETAHTKLLKLTLTCKP